MHDDDRLIIRWVSKFFARRRVPRNGHGVDVGTGANLYPAMLMLPFVQTVTLCDISAANLGWLSESVRSYGEVWDPYWDALCAAEEPYRRVTRPRVTLAEKAMVRRLDVFELPVANWDIGTMFFAAESITGVRAEFEQATFAFLRSLKGGSAFAAGFMKDSTGYPAGSFQSPAVTITESDVRSLLQDLTTDLVTRVIITSQPVRPGHVGMVLALGHADINRE